MSDDQERDAARKLAARLAEKIEPLQLERAPRGICFADASELFDVSMDSAIVLLRAAQGAATRKEIATQAHKLITQLATCKQRGQR